MTALLAIYLRRKRCACRHHKTNDNLALSFIRWPTAEMASIVEQNPENRTELPSARRESASENAFLDDNRPAGDIPVDDLPDIIDLVMAMGQQAEAAIEPASAVPGDEIPSPALPSAEVVPVGRHPSQLDELAERARGYVEAASSANTRRAYAADWKHFCDWLRRQNLVPMPPDPETVGLYITACASGGVSPRKGTEGRKDAVSTIERRLSSLTWNYAQRGLALDRKHRAIATVMAGIRNAHARPPRQKEALLPEDLVAMLETLERGNLRGLRDRAMLLLGFAGALRRSEIVGLDCGRDQTEDGCQLTGYREIRRLSESVFVRLRAWRRTRFSLSI